MQVAQAAPSGHLKNKASVALPLTTEELAKKAAEEEYDNSPEGHRVRLEELALDRTFVEANSCSACQITSADNDDTVCGCTCPNGTPTVVDGSAGTLCDTNLQVDCSECSTTVWTDEGKIGS